MRSFGKFLARRKPVQLYCGAAAAADKGSLIRVLDPEIEATHVQVGTLRSLKKDVFTNTFPCLSFITWLNRGVRFYNSLRASIDSEVVPLRQCHMA